MLVLLKKFSFAILALALAPGCMPVTGSRPAGPPFVVPPCTATPEKAYVCEADGWSARFKKALGEDIDRIVDDDRGPLARKKYRWTTDACVLGWQNGRPTAIYLPGEADREEWAIRRFAAPYWQSLQVGHPRMQPQRRMDAGGNVLVSPPLRGVSPAGRLIVGRGLQGEIKAFLRNQRMQTGEDGALIEVDTGWLKVGHVDEALAFLPSNCRPGFFLVRPDPLEGLRMLKSLSGDRVLFCSSATKEVAGRISRVGPRFVEDGAQEFSSSRWSFLRIVSGRGAGQVAQVRKAEAGRMVIERVWDLRGHSPTMAIAAARNGRCESMPIWFENPEIGSRFVAVTDSRMWLDQNGEEFPAVITAGELISDPILAQCSTQCDRKLERMAVRCAKELGLARGSVVRLPVLLAGNEKGREAWWLLPNPVNWVVWNEKVVLLEPNGPRKENGHPDCDLFREAWTQTIKNANPRIEPVFLDGWDALHRNEGGVRCGTNVLRRLDACK